MKMYGRAPRCNHICFLFEMPFIESCFLIRKGSTCLVALNLKQMIKSELGTTFSAGNGSFRRCNLDTSLFCQGTTSSPSEGVTLWSWEMWKARD